MSGFGIMTDAQWHDLSLGIAEANCDSLAVLEPALATLENALLVRLLEMGRSEVDASAIVEAMVGDVAAKAIAANPSLYQAPLKLSDANERICFEYAKLYAKHSAFALQEIERLRKLTVAHHKAEGFSDDDALIFAEALAGRILAYMHDIQANGGMQ